jgi:hypothetical protein
MCNRYVFCVMCGSEWNVYSMWNGVIVGDMWCCGESTFIVPNHIFLFYNKVYTILHTLLLQKVYRNGKVFVINLSIKLKIMTLLWSSIDTWTSDDTQGLSMLFLMVVLYLLRDTSPFFASVWNVVKILLFIILMITTLGLIGKWLKKVF